MTIFGYEDMLRESTEIKLNLVRPVISDPRSEAQAEDATEKMLEQ